MSKMINITDADASRDILTAADHGTSWNSNNSRKSNRVSVSRIIIANTAGKPATISIFIRERKAPNAEYYFIKDLDIPVSVTYVWDQPITINQQNFDLRLANSAASGTPGLTVIID